MIQNFEQQAFLNPSCLIKVKDIYGGTYWINKNQLSWNREKGLNFLGCYRKDGRRLRVKNKPTGFQFLHMDNIPKEQV